MPRSATVAVLLACMGGTVFAWAAKADEPLVADLSNHLVAITTGFDGASLLLFGAIEADGDVVVVVRGPPEVEHVRRRGRLAGVWVNRADAVVSNAPAFYQVAATHGLPSIAPPSVLDRHQIGVDHLDLKVLRHDRTATDDDYRQALLRIKESSGLYTDTPGTVTFVGKKLFRADMNFPANVPTGLYTVDVYFLQAGEVVSAQSTPLSVSKTGIGSRIFDFAERQGALYGMVSVMLAIGMGWTAAALFRRR